MENVLFFFANLPVYSYGAMLGIGLLLGTMLAQREGKRKGLGTDFIFRYVVQTCLVFIVAGRLACVFHVYGWRVLIYPWTLLASAQLDEVWGAIGAAIYTAYFLWRQVQHPAEFLDILAPQVALMQSFAYLGSSILGRETTSFLGVDLGEFMLHPLPLYGAFAYYILFSFLWRKRRNLRYDGQLFIGYLALSALFQRLLMPFREVFGESTNPWLYTLAAFLFGAAWFYLYIQSPPVDSRRRKDLVDWHSWALYLASLVGVGLIMYKFFFWRFS